MTIEEKLQQYILSRYKNMKHFSEYVDMPYQTINSIFKRGVINAGISNIIKICEVLNLDVDELAKGILAEKKDPAHSLTLDEQMHIKKYRTLNEYGKKMVDFIINTEIERTANG